MTKSDKHNSLSIGTVDWWSVLIYLALVALGWLNIYSAVYDDSHSGLFDLGTRYGMQMIWIGVSFFIATAILLIDDKYYHILAYPAYWLSILVLVGVLFFGHEVKGAKSWIQIGSIAIQPTELVKFTTSLALARCMSRYTFSMRKLRDVITAAAIIALPAAIIIMQHDVGSAVVYAAFLIVFYREGLSGWVFAALIAALLVFVFSFVVTPFAILATLIVVCVAGEGLINGRWRGKAVYLSALALTTIAIYFGVGMGLGANISLYASLLIGSLASLPFVLIYAYRNRLRNVYKFVAMFVGLLLFVSVVDYDFGKVLETHQHKRVLDLLGIEKDLTEWGYNVNQSKIAIGSGGFAGKGYMHGTQTRFNFVPEQSTDFIFCTVGEEWGFVGSTIVVALFFLLILRLIKMAERQHEAFNRIYCYCVASIFLVHVLINIGMTIGLLPVIGIPLPFFSYGGSSMVAFTLLFFAAVKLDSNKRETGFSI